jgi:hypothetical protein
MHGTTNKRKSSVKAHSTRVLDYPPDVRIRERKPAAEAKLKAERKKKKGVNARANPKV